MSTFADLPKDELRGFLISIYDEADESDQTARFAFADWLEDHSDPRAELIRLQAENIIANARQDREEGDRISVAARQWMDSYAEEWLGRRYPRQKRYSACMFHLLESRLVAKGLGVDWLLAHPHGQKILKACREGWFNKLHLQGWADADFVAATKLKLFDGPLAITISGGRVSNDDAQCFQELTHLRSLSFEQSGEGMIITDDWLSYVVNLRSLRHLSLVGSNVLSGTGLKHLSELKKLRSLKLIGLRALDGENLAHLTDLAELQELNLSSCRRLKDADLRHLLHFPQLLKLNLRGCHEVTNAGLIQIAQLVSLRELDLRGLHQLTHTGIKHLAALRQLEVLSLSLRRLLEEELAPFHQLSSLKKLRFEGLYYSRAPEIQTLRKSLPDCQIVWC